MLFAPKGSGPRRSFFGCPQQQQQQRQSLTSKAQGPGREVTNAEEEEGKERKERKAKESGIRPKQNLVLKHERKDLQVA